MIRVYQYGLLPPTDNEAAVRAQLRSAHEYRNDLVAIERGRRWALREIDSSSPEVVEAMRVVKQATRSLRKDARKALAVVRRKVREEHAERLAEIAELDASIRRDARALTACYWGSYLSREASADQIRKLPLYEDDGVTPNEPRFVRWNGAGQVGVQLQGGLATPDILSCKDTRVRIDLFPRIKKRCRHGILWLRIGSETDRSPVWAKWPLIVDRELPDNAKIKWARVSCRREGPWERWTVELTLDIPGPHPRSLDPMLEGAIAVEVSWDKPGDALRVASWRDTFGESGEIFLPVRIAEGIRKPDGIRSVRDQLREKISKELQRALRESFDKLPLWLSDARDSCHVWKSPGRFDALAKRWRAEKCDAARPAYDLLQQWELRNAHLYEYETGARMNALRSRKHFYRNLAAQWSRKYKHLVVDDRNLSREARWGDDSDLRFTAGPSELRTALEHAFADDVSRFRADDTEAEAAEAAENPRPWVDRAIEAWQAGGARDGRKKERTVHGEGGAWASRKAKKKEQRVA